MNTIDSATRQAIAQAVREEISAQMPSQDRWLSREQVLSQYGMISPDFLKRHAFELERKRLVTPSGKATRYAYRQSSIEALLQ